MMQTSRRKRQTIWCLIGFTHLVTIFCVIWFFIGHVWFLPEIARQYYACSKTLHHFTQIIVLIQYIAGVWFIFCSIWNSPRTLRWLEKTIQHRLSQFSNDEQCDDKDNTTEHREIIYGNVQQNEHLNCI